MRKDWKYILYLAIVIGIYAAVKLSAKKQNDWSVTYAHQDKDPYGTYALNQLLHATFKSQPIHRSYKTFYELKDSLAPKGNVVIIASTARIDKADTEAIFNYVEEGGNVLIAADYFGERLADTLGISSSDYFFNGANPLTRQDTSWLKFTSLKTPSGAKYYYKRANIHNFFSRVDSVEATVIARNDADKATLLRILLGKGQLLLCSTPMAFTNIYLLSGSNHEFVSHTLSYMPVNEITVTEYYHLGRMEASTPLRFILTTEPLTWAYYIVLFSILFFMLFEVKRKQRIIPILLPLANSTLEFVSTIGNLYYHKGDHKNIAEKKIQFFLEHVRTQYYMTTNQRDKSFIDTLARKSGNSNESTDKLIRMINETLASEQISRQQLIDLNKQLELFYKPKY